MPAVLVLGMHRSGTSCLAGMLIAAGWRPPGPVVRNWDNARGHHEATAAVRLSETVLARSGGSWLQPPERLTWTAGDAAERDRLLAPVGEAPALIKDPRALLCADFWLGGAQPLAPVGVVRHPLAVARSLASWRQMPLDEGLRLWLAHNRALRTLRDARGIAVLDFAAAPDAFAAAVAGWVSAVLGSAVGVSALRAAYVEGEVHHDGHAPEAHGAAAPDAALLREALALHRDLVGDTVACAPQRAFPWVALAAVRARLAEGDDAVIGAAARAALAAGAPAAVLVPLAADLLRAGHHAMVAALAAEAEAAGAPVGLTALVTGKAALAAGDAAAACRALARACAGDSPYWEARTLLAEAFRRAGRAAEARAALAALVEAAVHPHQVLARLAEWTAEDGDAAGAIGLLRRALDAAPAHRRGRLRTRLADLLTATGDPTGAEAEARAATGEDPRWARGWLLVARAHAARGEREAALAAIDRALALEPERVEALLVRARLHLDAGDRSAARSDALAAQALAPRDATAARLLAGTA